MAAPTTPASMQTLGYASPSTIVLGTRIEAGVASRVEESLAEETPVVLAYNLAPYAVMMATPADLEDFAVGFTLTEGIASHASEIGRVDLVRYSRGVELQIDVPLGIGAAVGERSRRLSGRTGCGICGTADVDQVLRELPTVPSAEPIDASAIGRAMRELAIRQPLNDETGAAHAAGWARRDGTLVEVREDVGRHNALDKLVGALVRRGEDARDGFVVMTSRGSFELVQKVAVLGAPLLATVSAPTAMAVRVAASVGMALVGFARGERVTVYAGRGLARG